MAAQLDEANGINEAGTIVGALAVGGALNAAIAVPVPPSFFAPATASTTLALPPALLHRH